jgi:hypothetical protein
MAIKFYTIATHSPSGFERLVQSAGFYGIDLTVLGAGLEWVGFGQKVNLFKTELQKLNDNDIVGFVDGFDVVFLAKEEEMSKKFHALTTQKKLVDNRPMIKCPVCAASDPDTKCLTIDESEEATEQYGSPEQVEIQVAKVVFGAEEVCAPDPSLVNRFPVREGYDARDHNYHFLNSGNFIGEVGELKKITEEEIADTDNDQLYYQKKFLAGKPNVFEEVDGHEYLDSLSSFEIVLDYGSDIFQCMQAGGTKIVDNVSYQADPAFWPEGRWGYRDSFHCPCILHGHEQND